jgi:hypothetical protein
VARTGLALDCRSRLARAKREERRGSAPIIVSRVLPAERSAVALRAGYPSSEVYARLEADLDDLEGDAEHAIPLYEQSAGLLRRLGLDYELATVLSNLGVCHRRGEA